MEFAQIIPIIISTLLLASILVFLIQLSKQRKEQQEVLINQLKNNTLRVLETIDHAASSSSEVLLNSSAELRKETTKELKNLTEAVERLRISLEESVKF